MSHLKPVRRLYHQFSGFLLKPRLSADEIAQALSKAGLIEGTVFNGTELTHYIETPAFRALKPDEYRNEIQSALRNFARARVEQPVRVAYVQLTDVTLTRNSEWTAYVRAGALETSERKALGLRGHQNELMLEVWGEVEATGSRDEFEFMVSPDVTINHSGLQITSSTSRFDEQALERTLEEQFDHGRHEQDWAGMLCDQAHDRMSDD